jgi:hypothetical protein
MNSSSKKPVKVKVIFGLWTALWVVISMAFSMTLSAIQMTQPSTFSNGMKVQSTLLTGGSDESIN